MLFKDRKDAGKKLGEALLTYQDDKQAIVLALPRGGVVIGAEVARLLDIPLDLILVRKLGVPWQEELALGAIAGGGIQVLNNDIVTTLNIDQQMITRIIAKEQLELNRRNLLYRHNKPFPDLTNKIVILVDDGIATGATMRAAISVVKKSQPQKIVVAVPVASSSVFTEIADELVEVKVLATPTPFYGIGMWYGNFAQVSDQEVVGLLQAGELRTDGP